MRVISLFDGISCGRVALERAGIPVQQYIASEIDKYAVTVSKANHPDIIHLGDVRTVRLMAEAGVFGHIDLLIGGSPCQGFSFAGKQLAFDDPRSALFFEFVHILTALRLYNPNVKFLLENVRMKKEHLAVITQMLGVEPILVNSALVSAQSRQRYYWCNWVVEQPTDRGILLRDIIESGEVDRDKSYCIDANYFKGGSLKNYLDKSRRRVVLSQSESRLMIQEKSGCLLSTYYKENVKSMEQRKKHKMLVPIVTGAAIRGRYIDDKSGATEQGVEVRPDGKSNALTSVQKDSMLCVGMADINAHDQRKRVYSVEGKAPSLLTPTGGNHQIKIAIDAITYRKLTPIECERLQTLPDDYTYSVSNTQRYKMLGNGWNVDTIVHIFLAMVGRSDIKDGQ